MRECYAAYLSRSMRYCSVRLIHSFLEESHGCPVAICLTKLCGVNHYNSSRQVDSQDGSVVRGRGHLRVCHAEGRLPGAIRCESNNNCPNSAATIYRRTVGMCAYLILAMFIYLFCADTCVKCIVLKL